MILNYYLEVARLAQEIEEKQGLSYKSAIAEAKKILQGAFKNGGKENNFY